MRTAPAAAAKKAVSGATESKPVSVAAPVPAPAATAAAAPVAAAAAVETPESREKKAKAVSKKLKQIQEIKAKLSSGQAVEPEQARPSQLHLYDCIHSFFCLLIVVAYS